MEITENKKKQRRPLTKKKILRTAMTLADKEGFHGVSMRVIAKKLKVEAMSLYHHFKNKEAIVDEMVDQIFLEFAWPDEHTPSNWKLAMTERADKVRTVLKKHPWALGLLESRTSPGPNTLAHHDAVIGCLRKAGFSIQLTAHAYALLDSYIFGFATQELNLPFDDSEEAQEVAGNIFENFPVHLYPNFIELTQEHFMVPGYDFSKEFDFGFELILDGLERKFSSVFAQTKTD